MKKKNPLRDEKLLKAMSELKEKDPVAFMDLVYSALSNFPESILEDDAPIEKKIFAVNKMMKYYEGTEMYERCAFLLDTLNKLKDEEGPIRSN